MTLHKSEVDREVGWRGRVDVFKQWQQWAVVQIATHVPQTPLPLKG